MTQNPTPPKDLSRQSKRIWRELTTIHAFEAHELVTFERALRWWDVADTLAGKGETKGAMDASACALRHWRTLKFPAPDGVRRPGRPSGDNWSAKRKAAARNQHDEIEEILSA